MSLVLDSIETGSPPGNAHRSAASPNAWSFVNHSGDVLLVRVAVTGNTGTPSCSGVTYNGAALTKVGAVAYGPGSEVSLWQIVNPATGSNTVQVSFTAGGATADLDCLASAISFRGSNTSAPVGTPVTASDTSTYGVSAESLTLTGTSASNMVVSAVAQAGGIAGAIAPAVLDSSVNESGTTGGDNFGAGYQNSAAGAVPVGYSFVVAGWAGLIAVEVIAAPESGAGSSPAYPAFPSLVAAPSNLQFGLIPNTQSFAIEQLNAVATFSLPGDRWACHLEFDYLTEPDWRLLSAFLANLDGEVGRFYFGPFFHAGTPKGKINGNPLINGAGQTGTSLTIKGLAPNTSGVLKVGDYISFPTKYGSELHQIVQSDVTSDANGDATLMIAPPIRISPADGASVVFANPSCVMKMKDTSQAGIGIDPPLFGKAILDFIEVVPSSS